MIERLEHHKRRSDAGLTLIELLVVITILGILAAIVVFSTTGLGDRGQSAACITDETTIMTAQEARFAQVGSFANSVGALVSGGFLSNNSQWHTTTATGPPPGYDVDPVPGGPCDV